MNRKEILSLISGLSHSQGLYGRILETLHELQEDDEDYYNELMSAWEDCKFDQLGFIEFVESEPVDMWNEEDVIRWREEKNGQ